MIKIGAKAYFVAFRESADRIVDPVVVLGKVISFDEETVALRVEQPVLNFGGYKLHLIHFVPMALVYDTVGEAADYLQAFKKRLKEQVHEKDHEAGGAGERADAPAE